MGHGDDLLVAGRTNFLVRLQQSPGTIPRTPQRSKSSAQLFLKSHADAAEPPGVAGSWLRAPAGFGIIGGQGSRRQTLEGPMPITVVGMHEAGLSRGCGTKDRRTLEGGVVFGVEDVRLCLSRPHRLGPRLRGPAPETHPLFPRRVGGSMQTYGLGQE